MIKFEDVSRRYQVEYNHLFNSKEDKEFKGFVFPSVTIFDFDKNGMVDIFFSGGDRNYLYLNLGEGTYREASAEFGISCDQDSSYLNSQAVLGDFNADGEDDLYLATAGKHRLFFREKNKNKFREVTKKLGGYSSFSHGVNVIDFNRDGRLDIVVANFHEIGSEYREMKFTVRSDQIKNYGAHNDILIQDSSGNFEKTILNPRKTSTNAVGISDINSDGFPDIFFANDYGPDELLMNVKGRTFVDSTRKNMLKNSSLFGGKNVEFADYNQDGLMDLFVTNAYIPPYQLGYNMLWKKIDAGMGFKLVSVDQNIGKSGLSWGSKVADFNLDGKLDVFVANGLARDLRSEKIENEKSTWFEKIEFGRIPIILRFNKKAFEPNPELLYHRFGFERDALFIQGENEKFYDVALDIGLTDDSEGRGVATADLNNDGHMDVVVTNFQGKSKTYLNKSLPSTSWIGFSLHSANGSLLPIGAKIILKQSNGPDLVKEFYPANGFRSQSDPRLLFSLNRGSHFKNLQIEWPSKQVKIYSNAVEQKYNDLYE